MKKKIYYFLIITTFISYLAAQDVSREQIEKELSQAEKDFQIAKNMFNPWYGGPLITGSGNVIPPGYININPQLQIKNNYAVFNGSRKVKSIHDKIDINPALSLGAGLFNRVDMGINVGWDYKKQSHVSYDGFTDFSARLSLAILKESPYIPALKIAVQESFPIGKYKNLNPDKANVQAIGSGSYKTEIGLGLSKVVWWWLEHPMQFRLSINYGIPAKVSVENFHSYGGGYGTDGKIKPGNYFNASLGYEFSMTQKVVFAIDFIYEYDNKTTFKGVQGIDSDGEAAVNEGPSGDVISLAPALEYIFTPDIALIGGLWFSVCGRNSSNFIAGIVSFSYGF